MACSVTTVACRSEPADPQQLFTTQAAAVNFLQRGQLAEAEVEFKKVIDLAPRDPLGYANLGLTYLRGGRYADAEAQLRRARRMDEANADVGLMLARLYSLTGRHAEARRTLEGLRRDARVMYALAELESERADTDSVALRRHEILLRETLAAAPANLAVRVQLLEVLARRGVSDSVVRHLEELRRLRPEPPKEAKAILDQTIADARAGRAAEMRERLRRFVEIMEVTAPYQASLEDIKWVDGPLPGRPVFGFQPQTLIATRGLSPPQGVAVVRFIDVTDEAGLSTAGVTQTRTLALGDYDGDGTDNLFVSSMGADGRPVTHVYNVQGGFVADVTETTGISLPAGAMHAQFVDVDNDGWLDLFAIGGNSRGHLLRNTGSGKFEDATVTARVGDVGDARVARFADLDHDGDLDLLLVGGSRTRLYRNNLDGTFTEIADAAGLGGSAAVRARDAAFGDFDDDGRTDVLLTGYSGDALFRNVAFQRFEDATASSGLSMPGPATGTHAVGDYDNDGMLDIFSVHTAGDRAAGIADAALRRNRGDGAFAREDRSGTTFRQLSGGDAFYAEFFDYDNDGWSDLVVVTSAGTRLFRNTGAGRFEDRSNLLPTALRFSGSITVIEPGDADGDGDLDLFVGDSTGVRLLRNDGGNVHLAMHVQLVGLTTGSGKNNTFGIGSTVEVRAGEIFQTRLVTNRITHFGLGPHLKADVMRVRWTNGVPQTIYFPGTDADVLELEQLKGSCAFLYTWDGKGFRFVTDVMWRSALGMPLGLMAVGDGGAATAWAPAGASQEYLRIPGDALKPRNGRYVLQITEELWETAYLDEIRLIAVDHPDSVDVFVDERFVPPGPVTLRLLQVSRPRPPVSATDERGESVLAALREKDDVYLSNLTPRDYQGTVETHDLVLDLGTDAGRPGTHLFLRGWIYPTDASINIALSQRTDLKTVMPSIEVRNARGQWQTAIPNIAFPSGKDKTVAIDLTGKFPTQDHRVRIRTSMQIYWDQAFTAAHDSAFGVRMTTLPRSSADLHFRGFSRMYRRGGPYGPHWFAYDEVTKESPWRTIRGSFTRFGNVLPLLGGADDMYVVMAPGDEATIEFDAGGSTAAPPPGWRRTFLLYTDGWIKDADLNTAFGNTVEPLPFHALRQYPYAPGESYPADSARQRYLREYNTRLVKRAEP